MTKTLEERMELLEAHQIKTNHAIQKIANTLQANAEAHKLFTEFCQRVDVAFTQLETELKNR